MRDELAPDVWDDGPNSALWVRDGGYIRGWLSARRAADDLNAALSEVGFVPEATWARPRTGACGTGVVAMRGTPNEVHELAELLRGLLDKQAAGGA